MSNTRFPGIDYGKYERRKLMFKIFKNVDEKLEDIGFIKMREDKIWL